MIRTLEVDNLLGHSRTFALGRVDNGVVCTDIQGLGPVKAELDLSKASSGGAHFLGSYIGTRNIVITLELSNSKRKTVEEAREEIYYLFDIGREVGLTIESDSKIGSTKGYVESVDPDIFSKKPTLQISILSDPYFVDEKIGRQSINLPQNEKWGYLNYAGNVVTGVTIEVVGVKTLEHLPSSFTLKESITGINQNEEKALSILESDMASGTGSRVRWSTGDRLVLNTTPGEKSATFRYSGKTVDYPVMEGVRAHYSYEYPRTKDWFELKPFVSRHGFRLIGDDRLPSSAYLATVSWNTVFRGF